MPEFKEVTEKLEIPKNTGKEGFMLALRKIIDLPRVQTVHINANGKVTYTRVVREGEEIQPMEVDFDSISPGHIIRNSVVDELEADDDPARGVARLFERAAQEHLCPVALASGPATTFWGWHQTRGLSMSPARDEAYGLPFLYDEYLPAWALVLCAGYTRESKMIDVKKCFKMLMPEAHHLMRKS